MNEFVYSKNFCVSDITGGSIKVIQLWGKDSRTAIQFISFSFALGCVISPLITEPFLAPILANETYLNVSNALAALTLTQDNLTSQDVQVDLLEVTTDGSNFSIAQADFHASAGKTQIYYAFIISGAVVFLPFIPMILEWTRETSQSQKQKSRSEADTEKPNKQALPMHAFIPVMAIVCVFFFLYCPVEDTFAYFLATFVVTHMHWSKSKGAQITSASMALFACFRFLNMFFVRCLTSTKHIITSCLMVIVCLLGFVIFAEHGVDVGVWVCAMGIGAGVSAIFPTGLSWIKEEFITVTGPVTSTVMISCSLGTMANPLLVGYLMQTFNPMWFPRVLLMEMCGCLCTFLFLLALSRCYLKKRYFLTRERSEEVNVTQTEDDDISS